MRLPRHFAGMIAAVGVVLLTGCGADDQTSQTPDLSNARKIAVEIADGQVSPGFRTVTVAKGETVAITVASDTPVEVHVHGYSTEMVEIPEGQTIAIPPFVADTPGGFEAEAHGEKDVPLFLLQVNDN